VTPKRQPERTKFKVAPVDAPNVNGARIFGFAPGQVGAEQGAADVSSLRSAVEAGRVAALYVFDPGPDGSIGDTSWIVAARTSGTLPPGASFVEKDASYTNDKGILQGTSKAINAPGEAMEDWQIIVNLARALGVSFDYTQSAHIRGDIAARMPVADALQGLPGLAFERPMSARTWLEASNPSERWKWEFLYQDLPPVKGAVDTSSLPTPPGVIRLNEVK
jgi:hypothetical protein